MKNSDENKLCNILIGEAVIALFNEGVHISWRRLLGKLQTVLDGSADDLKRAHAARLAIQDIQAEMAIRGAGRPDNVISINSRTSR
ncbi:hypothetical protein [Pantoea sp. Lij88]|uniref:hypothetical protein n=1 Tax=Pantoea sp. Lij88 TaxID=3028622 RepID=UPI0024BAF209|nr:hypothetical protein [Pantoea sp. Lij88]WHQ73460.1 hypothetical protein PU624_01065 [Pantoea sp. Lij88]